MRLYKAQLSLWFFCILTTTGFTQDVNVVVYPDAIQSIDHRIFGHFLERPSWGGEAGIEDAMMPETGLLDPRVLQKLQDLNIPILRFPGGTDIDYMDWTDMVDLPERQERPASVGNQGDTVTNLFGIDEFAALTADLDCEAIIPVNFFDAFLKRQPLAAAAQHAAGLVAYCNAEKRQRLPVGMRDWPAVRADNGFSDPHDIKYFQIGNETWALWSWKKDLLTQANIDRPKEWYVECVRHYVDAIEAIDSGVQIIVDYVDQEILHGLHKTLGDRIDYYVFHSYMPWAMKPDNISRRGEPVDPVMLSSEEVWKAFVSIPNIFDNHHMSSVGSPLLQEARELGVKIAVTEWNWNGWWQSVDPKPLESTYAQAVGVAGYLHGLMRNADVINMACQSMLVGSSWGITGIRVSKDGSADPYYLPTAQVTSFYADHHGDHLLRTEIERMQVFSQPLRLAGIAPKELVAEIDVLSTGDENEVTMFFINRNFRESGKVDIDLTPFKRKVSSATQHTLTGVLKDEEVTSPENNYISINTEEVLWDQGRLHIDLPERSVTALTVIFAE